VDAATMRKTKHVMTFAWCYPVLFSPFPVSAFFPHLATLATHTTRTYTLAHPQDWPSPPPKL
jgi:hypothetical protein